MTTKLKPISKETALASFLDISVSDIESTKYDPDVFLADSKEYMVLTNDEADQKTADAIRDSLWAFNVDFIIDHSKLPYGAQDMIKEYQSKKCEDANSTIEALIENMEEFIDDAISADGRGHFLSGYDGEENENGDYFIYRIN